MLLFGDIFNGLIYENKLTAEYLLSLINLLFAIFKSRTQDFFNPDPQLPRQMVLSVSAFVNIGWP